MVDFTPLAATDVGDLTDFLREADLTLSGLDSPAVRLWVARDEAGAIVASTGYETSDDGMHALIRSVAVAPHARGHDLGTVAAQFAIDRAQDDGAGRAWLFSRRSGPFWQKLGFVAGDRDELARVLPDTCQVQLFVASGQLQREVAWTRALA